MCGAPGGGKFSRCTARKNYFPPGTLLEYPSSRTEGGETPDPAAV